MKNCRYLSILLCCIAFSEIQSQGAMRLDSIIYKFWNSTTGEYDNLSNKFEWVYNSNNKVLWFNQYRHDDISWTASFKDTMSYNQDGLRDNYIRYEYDQVENHWFPHSKIDFTYDINGEIIERCTSTWIEDVSQFEARGKQFNFFNAEQLLVSEIRQTWNNWTNEIINSSKSDYTYDSNFRISTKTSYDWNVGLEDWYASEKDDYTYDSNSDSLLINKFEWDEDNLIWNLSGKEIHYYDSFDDLIMKSVYFADPISGAQHLSSQLEINYDYDYNMSDVIWPNTLSNTPEHKMDNDCTKLASGPSSELRNWNFSQLYYSPQIISSNNIISLQKFAILTPNPTTGIIVFKTEAAWQESSFKLYDDFGRVVKDFIVATNKVDLSNLQSGIYFYRLENDHKFQSGKIVKL